MRNGACLENVTDFTFPGCDRERFFEDAEYRADTLNGLAMFVFRQNDIINFFFWRILLPLKLY